MVRQSEGFKRAAVQKFHSRGSRTVIAVAREIGISDALLYAWARQYATSPGIGRFHLN
jgi:transposase-like protein